MISRDKQGLYPRRILPTRRYDVRGSHAQFLSFSFRLLKACFRIRFGWEAIRDEARLQRWSSVLLPTTLSLVWFSRGDWFCFSPIA